MTEILVTSGEELDELLYDGDDSVPVLVLFTAPAWCIPCRQFEPHWIKAQELLPKHIFAKVNMGETPEDTGAHWATARFGIRGVPAVKLFGFFGAPVRDIKVPQGVIAFVKEVSLG